MTLQFDGKTAIVTGAPGHPSLGGAPAMLLAARGAAVLVKDMGADPGTPESTTRPHPGHRA